MYIQYTQQTTLKYFKVPSFGKTSGGGGGAVVGSTCETIRHNAIHVVIMIVVRIL